MTKTKKTQVIIEKKLGIKGDYQYKALHGRNYFQSNWHSNKLTVLDLLLNKYKPKTLLDLGTGSGNFELTFASKLKKIIGVDYNDEALTFLSKELKSRKITNVSLRKLDILRLPGAASLGKFDMIILIDVLEHLEIEGGKKLIRSFKKYLNPGGHVVIVTPNYAGTWSFIEKMIDRYTNIPHLEDMQHVTKFAPNVLSGVFKKEGYKAQVVTTFNIFSFLFPWKPLSSFLCRVEIKLELPFGNLLLGVFKPTGSKS